MNLRLCLLIFQSEVFAVAFALLAAGAVILTLNVLLLVLSLLGYCLFPLDVGAMICMLKDNVILKMIVVLCNIRLEFLGCLSIHEYSRRPKEKSSCILPHFPHVCVRWFSHHCH
ncbi:hypothetical protein RHGRI_009247 [Rhododendron griersonianum]|uniref:NADH dehydrogenase subunit 4L n=1 Tax=Rhododendron griersonianum TaxID=479676 RepID=A0AAV6L5J3_9ERIC|nr:hypothetical protein RHGRI_009247 [Rhododendron griersonianum]